jgi:predicted phosphodiesterase
MRVLIVGDVHGQHRALVDLLRQIQSHYGIRAAIQVGDFGFNKESMARLRQDRIRFPVPLHVIDGNHEDHAWLWRALLTGAARHWKDEANLIYQPRPSIARLGASTIGFLGGALHVDRPQQHNLLSRFPNYLLRHQRQQAATLFNREHPDLVVTHSCPAGIGIGMQGAADLASGVSAHIVHAGFDPGPPEDCGEVELKQLWRDLTHPPCGWVFGHFHCTHESVVDRTRFVCASGDLTSLQREFVLWDTEEKKLLTIRS